MTMDGVIDNCKEMRAGKKAVRKMQVEKMRTRNKEGQRRGRRTRVAEGHTFDAVSPGLLGVKADYWRAVRMIKVKVRAAHVSRTGCFL